MRVKFMAVTGSPDPYEEEQLGGKCLGVNYRIAQDEIYFVLGPFFYGKKARSADAVREVIVLSKRDVGRLQGRVATLHQAPGLIHGHGGI